jgi:hypothetical protein
MKSRYEQLIEQNIVIIGAGAAGFSAALELSHRGHHVKLIEQETLGSGASGRNPGRMGHGFHYVDIETAKMYLRESVKVQRKYPNYLIGQDLPFNSPLRHGRYFITKDSDYPKEQILLSYQAIKEEYQRLIDIDPENEVFGPVNTFFRILDPSEYNNVINNELIDIGVETAEHLFNWSAFLPDVKSKILESSNIDLYEYTRVETINRGELNDSRFIIKTISPSGEQNSFPCDYIINSTWENIEFLNDKIGLLMKPESRTNRLKTLLIAQLPKSLHNSNSMFFCMGQHCMISNMGDGRAMMTYAKVTNMEASSDLNMSENARRLLDGRATNQEKNTIAQQMLDGIKNYIPEMGNAIPENVLFGVVQTDGKLTLQELTDHTSTFHKRNYFGIREEQIGIISNPCVKLFYFVSNGELAANLVEEQMKATRIIYQCMQEIEKRAAKDSITLEPIIKNMVLLNLERYQSSELSESDIEKISLTTFDVIKKKSLNMGDMKARFFANTRADPFNDLVEFNASKSTKI